MISSIAEAHRKVPAALDTVLKEAEKAWNKNKTLAPALSPNLIAALDFIATRSETSKTAFTNIVTSLAIKVALPAIDVRYHQEQIQNRTRKGAGFSFRTVSEDDVSPWLRDKQFDRANSGWQTRTYERDDPYDLSFPHKIGGRNPHLKHNFLAIYHGIESKKESAREALRYLLFRQVEKRHAQKVDFATPRTKNPDLIVDLFDRHFFFTYAAKGASRLPVLAIHALYTLVVAETARMKTMELKPLEAHVAADSRTGALGDIEIADSRKRSVEAIEVKHDQKITAKVLSIAEEKISKSDVSRYYILTSRADPIAWDDLKAKIVKIEEVYECSVIVDTVQATLRYYLRLMNDPSAIFPIYLRLLGEDTAVSHEHRVAWNTVVSTA